MKTIFILFSEIPYGVHLINSIIDEPRNNITNNESPESTTLEYTILHLHNYTYMAILY